MSFNIHGTLEKLEKKLIRKTICIENVNRLEYVNLERDCDIWVFMLF